MSDLLFAIILINFVILKKKKTKVIIESIFRVIQEIKRNIKLLSLYDSLRIIFFKLRKILINVNYYFFQS